VTFVDSCADASEVLEEFEGQIEDHLDVPSGTVEGSSTCAGANSFVETKMLSFENLRLSMGWPGFPSYRDMMIGDVGSYMTQDMFELAGFPSSISWFWDYKLFGSKDPMKESKGDYIIPRQSHLVQASLDYCSETVQCTTDGYPNFETYCGSMMDLDIAGEYVMSEWGSDKKVTACFKRPTPTEIERYKESYPSPAPTPSGTPDLPKGGKRSYVTQAAFKCGDYIAYANAAVKNGVKFIEKKNGKYYALDGDEAYSVPFTLSQNAAGGKIAITCPSSGESRPDSTVLLQFKTVYGIDYVTVDVSVDANEIYGQDTGGLCQAYPCKGDDYYKARDGSKVEAPGSAYLGTEGSLDGAESWYEDSLLKIVGMATGIETLCLKEDFTNWDTDMSAFLGRCLHCNFVNMRCVYI